MLMNLMTCTEEIHLRINPKFSIPTLHADKIEKIKCGIHLQNDVLIESTKWRKEFLKIFVHLINMKGVHLKEGPVILALDGV